MWSYHDGDTSIWLSSHVDDLTVVSNNIDRWNKIADKIKERIPISINVPAEYILSMKINMLPDGRRKLTQRTYALDLLKRYLDNYSDICGEDGEPCSEKMKKNGIKLPKNPCDSKDPPGADHVAENDQD